jgi:predicted phage terminase large subunit-like protein
MNPAETAAVMLWQTVIENPYVCKYGGRFPSLPQSLFLTAPVPEILYGGAAGGGKSAGMLAAALQFVMCPGYDALILRRAFTDLEKPGGLIPLSHQWLGGTDAKWDGQTHRWIFPSSATLTFGHVMNEQTMVTDYSGSAFAFIGFDELTQFSEYMYRFLFSRKRKAPNAPYPTRVRGATNPGQAGHVWVKTRWNIRPGNRPQMFGPGRLFIPALLEDNPGLDVADYEASLAELPPLERAQLRHGDWQMRPEGGMFKRDWFSPCYVDRMPAGLNTVRYWDLAATKAKPGRDPDWCASARGARDKTGRVFVDDIERFRLTPAETEARVRSTAGRDGTGVSIRIEQEPGAASKLWIANLARSLRAFDVRGVPAVTDKVTRAKPASAAAERGDIFIVRGGRWVADFIDELCAFPAAEHDDQVDAFTGMYNELVKSAVPWTEAAVTNVLEYEYDS